MRIVPYNRSAAAAYAQQWAYGFNPAYYDFTDLGGDCTNFASQCLYAGSGQMNDPPVFGWYYYSVANRTASWTGVRFLYEFLLYSEGRGPFGEETDASAVLPGDLVQLGNAAGEFYHTAVITGFAGDEPLVCAHTAAARNRPLDTYIFAAARFIRIAGVRV